MVICGVGVAMAGSVRANLLARGAGLADRQGHITYWAVLAAEATTALLLRSL